MEQQTPQPGETWQHYKGGRYAIVAVSQQIEEEGGEQVVTYCGLGTGLTWTQSLARFTGPIEDGRPRFARIA